LGARRGPRAEKRKKGGIPDEEEEEEEQEEEGGMEVNQRLESSMASMAGKGERLP